VPVQVSPRPAELPLAGGRERATVRVHPLRTAEQLAPPGYCDRPSGPLRTLRGLGLHRRSAWFFIPMPAFLVEHPQAGPVLVDCGLHGSVAADPARNLGRVNAALYTFRMTPEQAVRAQLEQRGVDPDAVRTVVMTHLHYDHASAVRDFPAATFVVDRREWASATAPRPALRGYVPAHIDLPVDWRTVDHERDGVPHGPFARTLDLFGDGSVRLVCTPGHTAGHQSVLLRLAGGELLLTGDAAYDRRTILAGARPLLMPDPVAFEHSLAEVGGWVRQNPGATFICGHDPEQWAELEPVYA